MIHNESVKEEDADFLLDDVLFKLRDIELVKGDCDWRIEQQFTISYVLLVVINGQGRLSIGTHDYRLRPDTVYVCSPKQTFGSVVEQSDEMQMFLLKFDAVGEARQGEKPLFPLVGEVPIHSTGQIAFMCEAIYSQRYSQDGLERFRSQVTFQELLYCILKNSRLIPKDSQTALERTKEYMEEHYNDNVTIDQLARMTEISPKYFVDLFKKTYGISAIDYLTELRINRAKQFMAQTNVKLQDVARQVGYNDPFYFSRKFKKEVGVSPTVYMKSRRRKIAAYEPSVIGQLLALKIIPYAAPLHPKWTAHYHRIYRNDIPVHLSAYRQNQHWENNIETLLHARPDVVISASELAIREKERLEKVAPVFYVPWTERNWREHLQLTAEFLGQSEEAEHWLTSYDRKVKIAREQLKRKVQDDTFLIVRILKQNLYAYSNRSMAEVVYHDLQLSPAHPSDQPVYNQRITLEQLASFDADHLLLTVCQETETLEYWKTLQYSMLWQELKAVRNNRVHLISSDPWYEYSASAHERIVDELVRIFSGNYPK
ncbi:ABC transporter substrate-binding protein [Aneurinibacillus migulanus]|uniref:ABC transporter substrate-binding protein n=1 Tax=Aneurinibacillus migulanus TaxID=47500 RepID=UPI0020A10A53|nr:AraC family transcriptional regulator [Aneurinibacillus migulanus]MCP1358136.1 AraC family transcriptional regulator [Aneurinibacillus migulanus]